MPNTPLNPDALDKMKVAVSEVISETTYTCSRVWEAWQYGTMTDEDFEPAWENDTLLTEVVEAVLASDQPVVNSVEELDALPVGAVILDGDPCVLQMVEKSSIVGSEWAIANEEHIYTTGKITLPARVLYRPEVKP